MELPGQPWLALDPWQGWEWDGIGDLGWDLGSDPTQTPSPASFQVVPSPESCTGEGMKLWDLAQLPLLRLCCDLGWAGSSWRAKERWGEE